MKKRIWIIVTVVAAAALLSALLYAVLANHPPVIASLEAGEERVFPSESTAIVCVASDPDGDELSYEWSADTGIVEGEGATVTWMAPDYEGDFSVSVTVTDGRGGEVTQHVTIRVEANKPPVIHSLTADAAWALPSESLQVACNASDPDGHELTYEWSATGGNITGTGAVVDWTAPEKLGQYTITVVVSDGYGGSDTETLGVSVVTGQPPVVEGLVVTKDRHDHCYLRQRSFGYLVGREQKYDIECTAYHPDDLDLEYEWIWEHGDMSETSADGSIITWIAPDESVYLTITVTVSDSAGNVVTETVDLNVVGCSVCVFGYCS